MAGDYNKYRTTYHDKSTDAQVLTTTDYTTATALVSVKNSSYQLFIQRIIVDVTTYPAAGKTWTFQDSAGTPVPVGVASIPTAAPTTAGDTQYFFEFGPVGMALTQGKNLNLLMSATGVAGMVHVECYQRLVGPVAPATTN